jgi:hypothetical protein
MTLCSGRRSSLQRQEAPELIWRCSMQKYEAGSISPTSSRAAFAQALGPSSQRGQPGLRFDLLPGEAGRADYDKFLNWILAGAPFS